MNIDLMIIMQTFSLDIDLLLFYCRKSLKNYEMKGILFVVVFVTVRLFFTNCYGFAFTQCPCSAQETK